jgi:diaminohydroxyphosphoribosylaminopyrimidine deaminase/5-amino-6-(5-phosphoribosylamino)uracil reductase
MDASEAARWMSRAIELSRRGWPSPNPRVGCVIVSDGQVVGEGWHERAGEPHAEAMALRQAHERAAGGQAFVTLEPCAHFGRTPPCAHALVQAGISEVSFAVPDPNPRAAGGAQVLRDAGIRVNAGLMQAEAEAVNAVFLTAHRRGRPWLTLKAASTLDGFAARPDGSSKWITSPEARQAGHRLRAEMGAVAVGAGTILADNPRLDARLGDAERTPLRIALDPKAQLTGNEDIFRGDGSESVWLKSGRIADALAAAWERGVPGVLLEGGPRMLQSALAEGLADRIDLFVAGKWFGSGRPWWPGEEGGLEAGFELAACRMIGPDAHLTWLRKGAGTLRPDLPS